MILLEHICRVEEIQSCQSRAARERIARVRMRVKETTRHVVIVESGVDFIARQDDRQRQISAADSLRQTNKIRPDFSLFAREKRSGPTAANGDFVGDKMHVESIAKCAQAL